MTLVVVDNNEVDSLDSVLESMPENDRIDLVLCREPRAGIPFARNRALVEAVRLRADFIAFIDDDEVVDPNWFGEIMSAIDRPDVDVVSGAVFFNSDPLIAKYSARPVERDRAETDNVIFKSWIAHRLRFDESFAHCGGSDNLFFRQAFELGARIRTCESAIVIEDLPPVRKSLMWRLRRQWRYGIVSTMVERRLMHGRKSAQILALGFIQIPLGFAQCLVDFVRRREFGITGLERLVRGAGMLAGLVGIRYDEYKRD